MIGPASRPMNLTTSTLLLLQFHIKRRTDLQRTAMLPLRSISGSLCATSFLHDHGRRDALSLIAQGNKLAALRGSAGAKYRPEGGVCRLRCPLRLPRKLREALSADRLARVDV